MNKKFIILFLLLIILNIATRVPNIPHEAGIDSFRTHSLSNYIQKDNFAKWVLHPTSLMGLYPFSYSSGIPFILANLSDLIGLSLEITILLFSIFIALLGVLGMYIFVKEYTNNKLLAFFSSFVFSLSPLFLNFTIWTISTRAPFVALVPFLLFSIIKYEKTKNVKFLIFFIFLTLIESFIHRMFLLILLIIISYIVSKRIYYKLNKQSFLISKLYIFLIISFIILFLFQFFDIGPYKYYEWTYRVGKFFIAGNELGNLDNMKVFLNMVIDYASNVGIVIIFMPITIFYLFKKIRNKNYIFKDLFILILLLLGTPFLINGYYTCFFYLPIFSLLSSQGFVIILNKINIKKLKFSVIFVFLIIFLNFSLFMNYYWINFTVPSFSLDDKWWLEERPNRAILFMNEEIKEKSGIFISEPILISRIKAKTNFQILPTSNNLDEQLLIYDFINKDNLKVKFSPLSILTSSKSIFNIQNNRTNLYNEWVRLLIYKINSPISKKVLYKYDIYYSLKRKKSSYIRSKWLFYRNLINKNKIYDNSIEEIHYLR